MTRILALALLGLAGPALAQQAEEEGRAYANVLPMLQEVSPEDGDVLAACVVAAAEPAERAELAAAAGPSPALGPLVSAVLSRPATIGCIQDAQGG